MVGVQAAKKNKKSRTKSMEKQRGMAFGFRLLKTRRDRLDREIEYHTNDLLISCYQQAPST